MLGRDIVREEQTKKKRDKSEINMTTTLERKRESTSYSRHAKFLISREGRKDVGFPKSHLQGPFFVFFRREGLREGTS